MIYLQQPALVSAIGSGLAVHVDALLNPPSVSPLSYSDAWVHGKRLAFGAVTETLRPFPDTLPEAYRSRNNQLLWHCLAQIETQIDDVIQRYGTHRIGVVMGTSVSGADENIPIFQQLAANHIPDNPFNQAVQLHCNPADFIKHIYGLTHIAYGVSTACTSGARALMSAARLLNLGLCDAVICGGVDTLSPLTINGFHSLEVLSSSIAKPFSAHRDGINIGEAAAVFIATREAVGLPLLGYGASSDAYHMSSPHPDGTGAIAALQQTLHHANVAANAIGWINAHGTGTRHNDRMESHAIMQVFGANTPTTSTKPLTGHTLGAAGALEAALLWAMVSRQWNPTHRLPPQWWDGVRDTELPEIAITDASSRWQDGRRIGVSHSFAFGGNNAVLMIGEADHA